MWKLQVIGLILFGLAQAVIPPRPVFRHRKRADTGSGPDDIQAAGVLARTIEVIDLPNLLFIYLGLISVAHVVPAAPS